MFRLLLGNGMTKKTPARPLEHDASALSPCTESLHKELALTKAALQQSEARLQAALLEVAAAKEQRDSYRAVVEEQLDLICRFDAAYRLTFVNRSYARLCGKRPVELVGESMLVGTPPEYQAQVLAHLATLRADCPVAVNENPILLADGALRWILWTDQIIQYPDGTIEYQGVGRDITERKQAEAAERQQRQFAEAMRDSLAALTSSLEVEQVLTQILASAAAVVPSEAGSIILLADGYGQVAYCRGFSAEAATRLKQNRFAIAAWPGIHRAFVHKTPYEYRDTHLAEDWTDDPLTNWIRSSIGVPIACDGQMIGLLVADSATPNFFQPDAVGKLQAFAHYAGLALRNAYHAQRLEQRVIERTAALQASEDKFRQLLQAAPVAIVISDQAGQITLVNNQAEVLFGYQRAELLGQPIELLLPEAMRAAHVAKRALSTQKLQVRSLGSGLELFARPKAGNLVPVEIQLSYLETVDGLLIMSFILDITERKQAADALRHQRDFLQSVIDNIPDVIAVKNRQGDYHLANQALAQLLGVTPALLVGKGEGAVPDPHAIELAPQAIAEVFTAKQALFVPEQEILGRYYQANLLPLPSLPDQEAQVLLVASDITERKRAEVALQQALATERELSALKSGFVTNVSHEFRTPLTIILSMTDTLRLYRHKLAPEQIDQRLVRINEQVQLLKTMMDDVLSLERMQGRRTSFKPVPCDPDAVCLHLISEFQHQLETKSRLLYTCAPHIPKVALDERLWRQILHNLITNALKYSEQPIAIHLAYSDSALVLTVHDQGRGIPDEDLKHLFQPFYRATNVGTIPGTGLGLSIAKESVELHRGSITVQSQVALGTTFTVTIPAGA